MGISRSRRWSNAPEKMERLSALQGNRTHHFWHSLGIVAALVPTLTVPALSQDRVPTAKPGSVVPGVSQKAVATLSNLQDAFSAIADSLEPAVVTVTSSRTVRGSSDGDGTGLPRGIFPFGRSSTPRRATGTGSGVIISKEGWILTNDHVVTGADKVTIKLHDGREFTGIVRRDYRSDLALVKISASESLPVAPLGNSDKIKIGHWAIAIGSPYKYEGSFSVGVISSLYRSHLIRDGLSGPGRLYPNMIQTDAAINPGNSGGPLVDLNGDVIGINTAIESEGGGSVGIGFAIPINAAKFVIQQLLEKGHVDYGYLGVEPTSITPQFAAVLKVEQGAFLKSDPAPDSPAAKAGLTVGDVITAIDNKPIRNELDLRTTVAQTPPGTTIDLTVVRDGEKKSLKATVEKPPREEFPTDRPTEKAKTNLGIDVQTLTDKLAEKAGVPAKTQGVVLKSIDPSSSAADVEELIEGLVILKINNKPIPSVTAFHEVTATLKSGDQARVVYQVGKAKHFVIIPVD